MSIDRRQFFKIAGLATLGLAGKPAFEVFAQGEDVVDSLAATPETPPPPSGPLTARRWAMAIDVRKCLDHKDCKKCVLACHQVHNVPDFGNPKDEIKWIWKESFEHAFHEQEFEHLPDDLEHQVVPIFCNHCDNPPCVRVCPTQATFRREDGIVMMDQHRCIGCRYCMAACPYGSRSFNWRDPRPFIAHIDPKYPTRTRGVVEKCNFCADRLAKGLLPACVEACEAKAMMFGDLEDAGSGIRELLRERLAIRRKPGLGTKPEIYYIV